jgi:hypothetical protein
MPNFNARADVYCHCGTNVAKFQPLPQPKPVHSGTITKCIRWIMKHHQGYPALYSIVVPLEAGFGTNELHYRDIETISKRPDFPRDVKEIEQPIFAGK